MDAVFSLLWAFLLTQIIECAAVLCFRSKQLVYCVFLCNLLTNPLMNLLLWLCCTFWGRQYYWLSLGVLETAVLFTETFVIKLMMKYSVRRAFLISLLINGVSLLAGIVIMYAQKGLP